MSIQFSPCDLHFPHKEWSGDERERQNYLEMERWANHFRKNCIPAPSANITVHRAFWTRSLNDGWPVYGDASQPSTLVCTPDHLVSYESISPEIFDSGSSYINVSTPGLYTWHGTAEFYTTNISVAEPYGSVTVNLGGGSSFWWSFQDRRDLHNVVAAVPGPDIQPYNTRIFHPFGGSVFLDGTDTYMTVTVEHYTTGSGVPSYDVSMQFGLCCMEFS